jgi:hypothetical protein
MRVGMPQGRQRTGLEHHPIHAEASEAEEHPKWPPLPPRHLGGEGLGIQRRPLPKGHVLGLNRGEGRRGDGGGVVGGFR